MPILANPITQRNLSNISPDTDRNLLLFLLEKLLCLIEQLWRMEAKAKSAGEADTQWQAALRKVHQALAELLELASSPGQVCP
jgi:hypothetical protein